MGTTIKSSTRPTRRTTLIACVVTIGGEGKRYFHCGNDYEALLRMEEEAGPAMHALLQSMGATTDEINRCPVRILSREDDLLKTSSLGIREPSPHCPVCWRLMKLEIKYEPFHVFIPFIHRVLIRG